MSKQLFWLFLLFQPPYLIRYSRRHYWLSLPTANSTFSSLRLEPITEAERAGFHFLSFLCRHGHLAQSWLMGHEGNLLKLLWEASFSLIKKQRDACAMGFSLSSCLDIAVWEYDAQDHKKDHNKENNLRPQKREQLHEEVNTEFRQGCHNCPSPFFLYKKTTPYYSLTYSWNCFNVKWWRYNLKANLF